MVDQVVGSLIIFLINCLMVFPYFCQIVKDCGKTSLHRALNPLSGNGHLKVLNIVRSLAGDT